MRESLYGASSERRFAEAARTFDATPAAHVQTVNRALRTLKAVLFFALERELAERNVMQRFRPFEGGKDERHVARGAFTEAEVQ